LSVLESKKLKPLIIETQYGLGDNVYHRAFVKSLCNQYEVYLKTPFTEIYKDLPVKFIKANTSLRTQAKNIKRSKVEFVNAPIAKNIAPKYNSVHLIRSNIIDGLSHGYGIKPDTFDIPKFDKIKRDKPICIVRPATIRTEWSAISRNPLAEYIHEASRQAMADYHVISIADIDNINEVGLSPLPVAHEYYNEGQLDASELIGMIQSADLVIGGVGFIVPMCIAAKVNLICILGGNGGYNHPSKITDPRMDLSKVDFIQPDNYCMCTDMRHKCNKTISNFTEKLKGCLHDRSVARQKLSMV
jgi:hypothetical protein